MSRDGPKFSMSSNPVYQIDFTAPASGKRIAATKRRVRFRFGFSNAEAIAQGLTGTDCRGAEHEVSLVWSLTSGKRIVMADGQEVHYSKGRRMESHFETSWTMLGGHTLKLIAYAAAPLKYTPGFRQFDLLLDGLSYFDMPKLYELGGGSAAGRSRDLALAPNPPPRSTSNNYSSPAYNNYSLPPNTHPEPQWDYAAEDARYQLDRAPSSPDFAQPPPQQPRAPPVAPPQRSASMPSNINTTPVKVGEKADYLEPSPVSVMDYTHGNSFATPPAPTPAAAYDEFAPVEPVAQPPSAAVVHNQILSAYEQPQQQPQASPSPPALANQPYNNYYHQTPPVPATPVPAVTTALAPPVVPPAAPTFIPQNETTMTPPTETALVVQAPPPPLTMSAPLNLEEQEEQHMSEMERAMKNLVNFDDISTPLKTPEQRKKEQKHDEELKKVPKSHGLPPTAPSWQLGDKPSLSDIKSNTEPKAAPSKEVMRTHAFDPRVAQAGMMVVYGSSPGMAYGGGGPPQIHAHGFGVPAQVAYQQNMTYAYQGMQQAQQQQQVPQPSFAAY